MTNLESRFKKYVQESSWDDIAEMAKTYSIEFKQENNEITRIKKQIKLTKELIHGYLTDENSQEFVKRGSFFVGLVKSIELLEKNIEKHEAKGSEFLFFLRALLEKIKKEKLVVEKPLKKKKDFERLKDAGAF
ncbi:MAG: hypothetical protein WC309_04255 [Candidatus Paceibacterota bacterium]